MRTSSKVSPFFSSVVIAMSPSFGRPVAAGNAQSNPRAVVRRFAVMS